jgi:hypothetical protein
MARRLSIVVDPTDHLHKWLSIKCPVALSGGGGLFAGAVASSRS